METLARCLRVTSGDQPRFLSLLNDPDALDVILDSPSLFDGLMDPDTLAGLTPNVAFYIATRHSLQQVGLHEARLAQYLAAMLHAYSHAPLVDKAESGQPIETAYLIELLRAVKRSAADSRLLIRMHIGNYSLYLTGIFPERLPFRSVSRTTPDFPYFCELGRSTFRAVADDRLAWEFGLDEVCRTISQHYRQVRLALNRMAELPLPFGQPAINHSAMLAEVV
jgi:hypothetical protein